MTDEELIKRLDVLQDKIDSIGSATLLLFILLVILLFKHC